MAFVFLETTFFLVVYGLLHSAEARVRGTKILGVLSDTDNVHILEVRYEPLTYLDAETACRDNGGNLAMLKTRNDMQFVNNALFYPGSLEPTPSDGAIYDPNFYWIGLKKHPEDDMWHYADGTLGIEGSRPMFDHPFNISEKEFMCGGVKTSPKHMLKGKKGNCLDKVPSICSYKGTHCIPYLPGSDNYDYVDEEENDFDCSQKTMSMLRLMPNNCNCTDSDKIRIDAVSSHLSCTTNVKWSSAYCVNGCEAPTVPSSVVLVDPEPHVFTDGSWLTLFCAGYFQVSRTIIPTNVHQVQCISNKSLAEEMQKIKCNPSDPQHLNKNIKRLLVEVGKNYALHCEFMGFRQKILPDYIIWVKDNEVLDIPTNEKGEGQADGAGATLYKTKVTNGGQLDIHNLSPESLGVYGCFGRYRNSLLPGNVFKLSTDESDISSAPTILPLFRSFLPVSLILLKTMLL